MSKKICHITTVHGPEDIRIFIKECTSLAKLAYEVHLIAPTDKKYVKNGVTIHPLISKWENRALRMFERVQKAKRLALEIDADLYHLHDPELLRIAHTLRKGRRKVIYDAHEDTAKQIMSKYYIKPIFRKIISSSFSKYENYVTSRIDGVVAATPSILEQFYNLKLATVNINNYPMIKEFEELSFDNCFKERAVCYAGGISLIRGIKQMIELSTKMPDVTFYIAGTFADSISESLVKEASNIKNFKFLGQITRNEIKELYAKSMVGLALLHPEPNHINSLPIKMFEYMSASIPVLVSNFELWNSIIEESKCGFSVDPFSLTEIENTLRFMLDDKELCENLGNAGKMAVLKNYNWKNEEEKLVQFYQKIIR